MTPKLARANRKTTLLTAAAVLIAASLTVPVGGRQVTVPAASGAGTTIRSGDFQFAYDERGVSALANPHDPFGATITTAASTGRGGRGAQPAATLGVTIAYRTSPTGDWQTYRRGPAAASADGHGVTYASAAGAPLHVLESVRD